MLPLESEQYYHVFNRANGWERIFTSDENYRFFLQRYQQLVSPYVKTLCYCLMPNHFHLLIQTRSRPEILEFLGGRSAEAPSIRGKGLLEKYNADPEKFMSKQFSNFFSSYTQSFNKQEHRMGSLFMKNFRRNMIRDEEYFRRLVHYIHYNPVKARLCENIGDWKHSSYRAIAEGAVSGLIQIDTMLERFGGLEDFKAFHSKEPQFSEHDEDVKFS